jgi:hypothetical protein
MFLWSMKTSEFKSFYKSMALSGGGTSTGGCSIAALEGWRRMHTLEERNMNFLDPQVHSGEVAHSTCWLLWLGWALADGLFRHRTLVFIRASGFSLKRHGAAWLDKLHTYSDPLDRFWECGQDFTARTTWFGRAGAQQTTMAAKFAGRADGQFVNRTYGLP